MVVPHNDALEITTKIGGFDVKQMLMGEGLSSDIMFMETITSLGRITKDLKISDFPFLEFAKWINVSTGEIRLSLV